VSEPFDFSGLIRDPARVEAIPASQIPALLTQLSTLQTAMAARLIAEEKVAPQGDNLLTIEEAAARLGVSADWLYRRTRNLPFVVRVGRHVRCSASGLDRFIRSRMGR
jgi:excisionase family DNA binding protein